MKYMLLLYSNPSEAPQFTPEEQQADRQAWYALVAEMKAAEVYLYNHGLSPVTDAMTVRVRNGKLKSRGFFSLKSTLVHSRRNRLLCLHENGLDGQDMALTQLWG